MKKKFLSAIMATFLVSTFLTGCGGSTATKTPNHLKL